MWGEEFGFMLSQISCVVLGRLGVLVSSECKTEITRVKIGWCVSIWDNAWRWIDTQSRDLCVIFSEKLVCVRLLSYAQNTKESPCEASACILVTEQRTLFRAQRWSLVCLLLVLTPQDLGSGRERSAQTVIRERKFSADVLPLNSFKP